MRKYFMTAGLAVVLAALAVSSASATSGRGMLNSRVPAGPGSNTAAVVNSEGPNLGAGVLGVTGATVSCPDTTYIVTSVTTTEAIVDPSFGPDTACVFAVSMLPVGTATVHTAGASLTVNAAHSVFNNSTGLGTDLTVNTSGIIVVTTSVGCTLRINAQSNKGGGTSLQSQNVNTAGGDDASASPWGSKINATSLSLTYTATGSCPGIAEHGSDSFFTGSVYVKNVWGSL